MLALTHQFAGKVSADLWLAGLPSSLPHAVLMWAGALNTLTLAPCAHQLAVAGAPAGRDAAADLFGEDGHEPTLEREGGE